jgi:transcriptional regulator with XRE-family HTH domain
MNAVVVLERTRGITSVARNGAVPELVRRARRHAGLTQSELAERLGTTQSAVSRWERGGDEPRLATLANIAAACGLTVSVSLDDGIDRAQIRQHLALSPTERLRSVANTSRLRAVAVPTETP